MNLRESTSELHKVAEQSEFNKRMVNGELNKLEYLSYLNQQYYIFKKLEEHNLPHDSLKRLELIKDDINELGGFIVSKLPSTEKYIEYLSNLEKEKIVCHVYLNYLAIVYGGQLIKTKIHGEGKMYNFENKEECILSIRKIQSDEWSDEVNKGFKFLIEIFYELQNNLG